ncbi:type II secretion system secretin GspD [Granulosicoccaceae sp. 1_MG-2023]|nr:type II secretion system secretin GspD [Granulosicoccaceae sp. 1_MG-2023]
MKTTGMKKLLIAAMIGAALQTGGTASAWAQQAEEENFTLNLNNTDIHSLIATVSKQTGLNFVIDPRVKAKVTVVSAEPMDSKQLYQVFLSVLQVHGYSAVPSGDLIKIVPDVTAKQGPVPMAGDDSSDRSDQLVTKVIPIVNVPAAQLVPILRPLVPQQGHLAAYASTNSLIITDRAGNIERLAEIIERVDRPDNAAIEVIRLQHATASELVRIVSSLEGGSAAQGTVGGMKVAADERTNSILVSGDQAVRLRVRTLIANLDTPVESGSGNTRVVYLKYANAEDILTVLNGVSQGQAKIGTSPADNSNNTTTAAQVSTNKNGNGTTVPALVRRSTTNNSSNQENEARVDIQADAHTNSLIITAPPDEMRNIMSVIEKLDIRRAQVLVEAIIAELSESNSAAIGSNFLVDGSDANRPIGYTNLGGATQSVLTSAIAIDEGSSSASLSGGLSMALGSFGTGNVDFGFLLTALASDANNNILSTPTLVTMDNQEAEIVVGQNLPFVTGQTLSSTNSNPFTTIERRDVGISLKVKPQINEGNNIKMEIQQDVESVSATTVSGASDITTDKRSIKTTVMVENKQTLVLGGLIDDQLSERHEKVPLLGDIPLLGNLFRYNNAEKSKRNLMVFLHPTIMRDAETADYYSDLKYNDLRRKQLAFFDKDSEEDPFDEVPVLPELRLYYKGEQISNRFGPDSVVTGEEALPAAVHTPDSTPEPVSVSEDQLPVTSQPTDEDVSPSTVSDWSTESPEAEK